MDTSPSKPSLPSPTSAQRQRAISQSSEDSDSSQATATRTNPSLSPFNPPQSVRLHPFATVNSSTTSLHSFSRPLARPANDSSLRTPAPTGDRPAAWQPGHRPRQHSQGFFEPSLPSANSNSTNMNGHTAEIAAREAMHSQTAQQHNRKRSQTIPDPSASTPPPAHLPANRRPAAFSQASNPNVRFNDGFIGGHSLAAATAANAAFPRATQHSPGPLQDRVPPPVPEKDVRPGREKTKMKLFSKQKSIGLSKDKDVDRKYPPLPSPSKIGFSYKGGNMSTTSLVDSNLSSAASFYSNANSSTSTLVPLEKEREKHKHHFLSRQKNKIKDDHFNLPLSSASSTSRPIDPNAPQSLYSFAAPTSPSHSSSFAKSVSGLDLRHGGRALREKKKEEKAAALGSSQQPATSMVEMPFRDREQSFGQSSDWLGPPSYTSFGQSAATSGPSGLSDPAVYPFSLSEVANLGIVFGVPGIGPDDAWPLLKARVLNIFEGEDPRPPIEDFNHLVTVHLRRCIQHRAPTIVIEDLNELLKTGFLSLDQTLRHVPDERLVPHLVNMWVDVSTKILPYIQAVFHPLDMEFKGRGVLMSHREAADFWGAALPETGTRGFAGDTTSLGEDLDVRKITLLTFRDTVILPRHDALMAIFSRLSLESINANITEALPPSPVMLPPPPISSGSRPPSRPGTAASGRNVEADSYNSAGSTLLETASPFSTPSLSMTRSRATSNTSAGSFRSVANPPTANPGLTTVARVPTAMDSAKVTEMVGRMLQCVSILASVQSGDDSQGKMEGLCRELKYNWLGRGRTGRQRRGFVGTKVKRTNVQDYATVGPVGA